MLTLSFYFLFLFCYKAAKNGKMSDGATLLKENPDL